MDQDRRNGNSDDYNRALDFFGQTFSDIGVKLEEDAKAIVEKSSEAVNSILKDEFSQVSDLAESLTNDIEEEAQAIVEKSIEAVDSILKDGFSQVSDLVESLTNDPMMLISDQPGEYKAEAVFLSAVVEDGFSKSFSIEVEISPSITYTVDDTISSHIQAGIDARGNAFAVFTPDIINLYASASAYAGVEAEAEHIHQETLEISGTTIVSQASSRANVFAGAEANADAGAIFTSKSANLSVSGDAFAGAEAELDSGGSLTINGNEIIEMQSNVAVTAGIGASLDADLGYEDGQINYKFNVGAALGIGGKVGIEGSFAAPGILTHPDAVFESLSDELTPGIISHPEAALEGFCETFEDIGNSIASLFE